MIDNSLKYASDNAR